MSGKCFDGAALAALMYSHGSLKLPLHLHDHAFLSGSVRTVSKRAQHASFILRNSGCWGSTDGRSDIVAKRGLLSVIRLALRCDE